MKKCPYCGQEYTDDKCVCSIDESPLESTDPKAATAPTDSDPAVFNAPVPIIEDDTPSIEPDGFRSLGRFDPFEAAHFLKKFSDAGVHFQIDNIERRVFTPGGEFSGAGYVTRNWIEIFVAVVDEEKATKILSADGRYKADVALGMSHE